MSGPELDPVTAESEARDADFAEEHDEPTLAHQDEERDEATPRDHGGPGGGMDLPER